MQAFDRRTVQVTAPDAPPADAPAVRDATAILARTKADTVAADLARQTYRTHPMPTLKPDAQVAPLLGRDERVVAVRHSVQLDRRQPEASTGTPLHLAGELYLTSRRLVLIGRTTLEYDLADIEEAGLSGERLFLLLRDGRGISLDVEGPRLLRVEIATARALARG